VARPIHPVVVGTAGHIDHGKSSLVRQLTGIDPDRLKEEKERGLTIDLGFAGYKMASGQWLGLVDVPGHERFVRNMVAGSTGLDIALLVVAADDGVMPQTREHLDILDLLGVRTGVIALTKIDMVDEETALLAEEEVRELVQGTVLENARILPVSSETGEGIEAFRETLEALAAEVEPRPASGHFRMPVQRVFVLEGIGTVVTGIPLSGRIRPGEEVEFLPGGKKARVRGLHAYGGKVEEAVAGHSTALSVPDAKDAGVTRGMVACEPGVFRAGDAVDLELRLLPRISQLDHRTPIRFHTGTSEVQGLLLLLDRDVFEAGTTALVRVLLEEPVAVVEGDRCLVRRQNPVVTVGGGRILRVADAPRRYRRASLNEELAGIREAGDRPEARIRHELRQAGPAGAKVSDVAALMGLEVADVRDMAAKLEDVHLHEKADRIFERAIVAAGEATVMESVDRIMAARNLAASLPRTMIRTTRELPSELRDAVLDHMIAAGRVRAGTQGRILFADRLKPLDPDKQAALDRITAMCEARALRPPTAEEIAAETGLPSGVVATMLARAMDEGRIETFADLYIGADSLRRAMRAIRDNCRQNDGILDIPALRDALDTSRKYLIPLLEFVDTTGLTILRGGVRRLLPDSDAARGLG